MPSFLDDDKIHKPQIQSGRISTIIDTNTYPTIGSTKP